TKYKCFFGISFLLNNFFKFFTKRKIIPSDKKLELLKIYQKFEEGEFSKIYTNEYFGYTKVTIEQPMFEDGVVDTDRLGQPKSDSKKRDYERVQLSDDIDEYYNREVKPHLPDSWMDRTKDKIGYEINFTKYFYKYKSLRSVQDIMNDFMKLEDETDEGYTKLLDN
ncbi:SAM-dependent DNA methyltransferase, partial [Bacteroidota bacterium]